MSKKIIHILSFIFVIFLWQACCTKKACSEGFFTINFYDFDKKEIDTVIVYQYEKDSHFVTLQSTTIFTSYRSYDSTYYYVQLENVDSDHDYIVNVPDAGLNYTLSELATKRTKCNSCIPFTPRHEYLRVLFEYRLNGQLYSAFPLKLYK
jgi:hypothetical protein